MFGYLWLYCYQWPSILGMYSRNLWKKLYNLCVILPLGISARWSWWSGKSQRKPCQPWISFPLADFEMFSWPVHSYTARGRYSIHVDSRGRQNTCYSPLLPNQAGEKKKNDYYNAFSHGWVHTDMFTAALPRGHTLPVLCTAVVTDRNLTRPTWPPGVAQATRLGNN